MLYFVVSNFELQQRPNVAKHVLKPILDLTFSRIRSDSEAWPASYIISNRKSNIIGSGIAGCARRPGQDAEASSDNGWAASHNPELSRVINETCLDVNPSSLRFSVLDAAIHQL